MKNIDALNAAEHDLLAVALGAPARQVMIRAEEIGPRTGWKDGYLSAEHGFCPPDYNEAPGALANSPGRIWSDLCERMPGCVARGRVRESVAALPLVEGTEDIIPDQALWAAVVALGMLCSIYRYEDKNDGHEGVTVNPTKYRPNCEMGDDLGEELVGIPRCIALPYWQISRRLGRSIPHLTFFDQSSFNMKIKDLTSTYPYVGRFDNMEMRWPVFGERTEIAFQKGCAETSASFQHGPDAIAACQEHVMNRNVEGLLREMIRLKEILERMPNAFHSINTNPNSGENYVPGHQWIRWGKFSAPLSKRCPASSGLQFPPFLVMDAFLGRKKYDSFLGREGLHLRAWLPSNLRAFIAAIEYHYSIPDFVKRSGDPRLMGVLDGIIEAYTGERGFMGTHRYKVFGILEIASKTGRTETNGLSGAPDANTRPWEETHRQFSEAMKERLEPYRGNIEIEPHEMRGTFEECRYKSRVLSRAFVDTDPNRSIAMVTLDLQDTGITFQPGDRLAVMPLNSWGECAKVAAALGLAEYLDYPVALNAKWQRFARHLGSVRHTPTPQLTVRDILRRGHLAPITKELALRVHDMLRASSNIVLRVLATTEWPVRGTLGDLLQAAVMDTSPHIWDKAFDLTGDLSWLADLIAVEVPRTYSISHYAQDLLPSTVDLTISRAEYKLCSTFAGGSDVNCAGVGSGFLNPFLSSNDELIETDEDILIGVSRPLNFQLPIDRAAPCAYFAGGSGIAPFRSFWQARLASRNNAAGRDILYLGVQSREKFCYEQELREHVEAGLMEVHLAFSRDSRGLVYDRRARDLIEKDMPPRYIDALIVEQAATVSELVMSKKQGGLGGYLYVCGSVAVFDSVMSGIRKAIYNHCSSSMETADMIINKAFAERRFMLDVFMSPKPLPCNLPTIPLSQLARHTGHRPGSRMWIAVHGSVYDVTDFCPMHPGGTIIIQSNAGVDCSKTFDNLAHTNNPEVSSLLTKYFVGQLTPKPDFHGSSELADLYDLWASYLRTTVETLVAHRFEMYELMGAQDDGTSNKHLRGSENVWSWEHLVNIGLGVRMFYAYQSRLLQGGFSALFGPKLQELVLKLSFSLADTAASGADTRLPDVLGIIARAKTSPDAISTSQEVALVGKFVCESSRNVRFAERGIFNYAARSVELDIELLEDIREEACHGMDAFDSVAAMDDKDEDQAVAVLATFLMQTLERMAKRLEVFYSKLARLKVYQPELERNPARARWNLVRTKIQDGSFFVLTQATVLGAAPAFVPAQSRNAGVDFDSVMNRIQASIRSAPKIGPAPQTLNAMHRARAATLPVHTNAMAAHENNTSLRAMSSFIDANMRSIRRLSRIPPMPLTFEQLQQQFESTRVGRSPTPPSSSNSSNSLAPNIQPRSTSLERMMAAQRGRTLNTRANISASTHGGQLPGHGHGQNMHMSTSMGIRSPPTPPLDPMTAMTAMMGKLNVRPRGGSVPPSPAVSRSASVSSMPNRNRTGTMHSQKLSTNSLRAFRLGSGERERLPVRVAPTF
ncbi:sulfite reductase [NADPH] flavoprotein alpha-component [Achaetomium macrosporum]|uniref:NADPH--hemoprotein reductase n=1 Tax=Achaetomium macrosporum TaxID=79813 RepID=A0AAN7HCS6_9PEZI|nr:sulfite reductase [NADPH] flavoprotein alpha-component [Achaetomium macrosporum]